MAANLPASGAPNAISPREALNRLMEGNRRYRSDSKNCIATGSLPAERKARLKGQHPIASVLVCSDSRVVPEFAFDQGPGDLFVVGVAGNVVDHDGLGSFEYAVKYLGTPLIMVLGHSQCGAIEAAMDDQKALPENLTILIDRIKPAVTKARQSAPANLLDASIITNVRQSVRELPEKSRVLREALALGKIEIVGAVYDLATGEVKLV